MLHRLIEYADAHGISGQEGFSSKRIRFLIQFSPSGKFLSIHDYGRKGEEFLSLPHLQFTGDVPTRQFLVDTLDFLALYPDALTVFRVETKKLLLELKRENDFDEIKEMSDTALSLFQEGNFAELHSGKFETKLRELLQQNGRESKNEVKALLKKGGSLENVFGKFEFKRLILTDAVNLLLKGLSQETDFDEIQSKSVEIILLLDERKLLELRTGNYKSKWAKLLKKRGRGTRSEVKIFLKKKGVVDAVFSNEEFKRIGKHQFCLRLLEEASEADPLLGNIAKAMDDPVVLEKIHAELKTKTPAPQGMNNATFAVLDGEELRIFVKENSWHEWWVSKHKELTDSVGAGSARCFLSGIETKPMLTHPKVKGLAGVGGNAETSLVSFDTGSPAFQSYGFIQGENAAVSVESAVKYTSAINHLLSHQHHRLAGTEIVYWYTKDVPETEDIIQTAFDGWADFEDDDDVEENPAQQEAAAHIDAKQFLQSIAKGERDDLRDVEYCALTLQGNQGRAVAQNWMEGRFVDLATNIEQWFSDLEMVRLSGTGLAKPPKLETLITCLLKEKRKYGRIIFPDKNSKEYRDWIKPVASYRDAIWRSAIGGRPVPFPENTVRLVLQRIRESMLTDEWENTIEADGEQMGIRRARLYARIGLMKTFLIRNHNQEVSMVDREKNKNSVYWLGCLFAELANLQREAHKTDGKDNVKSTIVDRFYTTASTCPKLVHGRLIAQSQHHLRKLEGKSSGAAHAISNKIASINERIDFEEVPDLLPLPDQSWFALGYYQQIAINNRERAEAIERMKAKALADKKSDSNKGDKK